MRSPTLVEKAGERIPWRDFEEAFGKYYSEESRPAKPVRLMVGLLLLKQMYVWSTRDLFRPIPRRIGWAYHISILLDTKDLREFGNILTRNL